MQAIEPPAAVEPAPANTVAEVVVVSRDTRSDLIFNLDTPLPLIKAGRTEEALLRQALFVTSTLTVVRGRSAPDAETLRWSYQPFLQHQLCFTSMTGQFSCAEAEVRPLAETTSGEAPSLPPPSDATAARTSPEAEAAHAALSASLRARGPVLFREDRRLKIDPMLKAAGVTVRASAGTGNARR